LEDLKLTREAGGVQRASTNELQTTLRWLFPDEEQLGSEHLLYARSLVETHLNRACLANSEQSANDPCSQAAAASLRSLFFQSLDKKEKAQTLRKQALEECGCSLSPDALRKREDAVLGEVADQLHADLKQRHDNAPQTIEEVVRIIRPLVAETREFFHIVLQLCYPFDPPEPAEEVADHVARGLWYLARLQAWARSIQTLRARPVRHTRNEMFFGDLMAGSILFIGFDDGADKDAVYKILREDKPEDYVDLWNEVFSLPNGQEILERWRAWMLSCFPTCTYHRARNSLRCQPHTLLHVLEEFEAASAEMEAGILEEHFDADFGSASTSDAGGLPPS
jgi:hypothetical protein